LELSVNKSGHNIKTYARYMTENLSHNNPNIRKEAALAIEKNKVSGALIPLLNTYFKGSFYLIPKIIGKIGKDNTKLLLKIAFDKEKKLRVRRYAIEGLGKIGDNTILNDLYKLLKDDNIYIRKSTILALADIGDSSPTGNLLNLLDKEDDWIKISIIWALGIIGDNQCIDKLIKMLSIRNLRFTIKKNIVNALGRIGDKRAVEILIEILKDQHSGLEDYVSLALEKICDKRAIFPLIKKYLNPMWNSKEFYRNVLNNISPDWKYLLREYDFKIRRRNEFPLRFFENIRNPGDWHYGYLKKSHYILNCFNEIAGCLNLIHFSIYNNTHLFYFDTLEVRENYRRRGLGTQLVQFMIKNEVERYKKFNIFLLVAKCDQFKLKFFSRLGFSPVNLRNTKVGTHCIMSYPFNENSEENCLKLFEFFNWREEKKEFISSDCKYAYNPNPTGLYWCDKKKIYVTGLEKQTCEFYIKEKEFYFEEKFFDLKEIID